METDAAATREEAPPNPSDLQPLGGAAASAAGPAGGGGAEAAAAAAPVDGGNIAPASSLEKRKREEEEEEGEEDAETTKKRNPLWKTSLCSYYRRRNPSGGGGGGGGRGCSHGDGCRYAHSEAELRPRPDNTWDPTSLRAKKLLRPDGAADGGGDEEKGEEAPTVDEASLDKCLIGLPRKWNSEGLKSSSFPYLYGIVTKAYYFFQGISFKTMKKKKGMSVGFVTFENTEQLKSTIEILNEKSNGGKEIKVADAIRKSHQNKGQHADNQSGSDNEETSAVEGLSSRTKSARDVVTPLAHMPYSDQLEHKKNSLLQILKRLTRNARKACPDGVPLPDWIIKSRGIGGLPCKLEGILESPVINGYRNKCEFSVGYSLEGKRTVGFMLGNFREGMTAIEEPVNCPNVSRVSSKYASIFQDFLQSSALPVWSRTDNTGFWRQFTVREGRVPGQLATAENAEIQIAEVMLIIQVCSTDVDEDVMKNEFAKLSMALVHGAAASAPPLPLTTIIVQDHKGISNAAPADCPLIPLLVPKMEGQASFFQVNTLAAERLYSLAGDWADLSPDTLLFDICCGTGTIGLTLAHRVGMVVGIEMNESAVSDAERNAVINGIKNCRFVSGKAEDVMGSLLKEYLGAPQQDSIVSNDVSETDTTEKDNNATKNSGEDVPASLEDKNDQKLEDINEESHGNIEKDDENNDGILRSCTNGLGNTIQENTSERNNVSEEKGVADASSVRQFKKVVAIVDPPRVIKALRTHPRIRRLVYISCNPESLVANAIELCTPTADRPEKKKGNRGWRNMSSAGLARYRTKSMPNSEPFQPVRAMAVDLFPHTPHCEMVMLLER
uniref:C3H1-type domain-containing protein n=1 Tax=Ananas comosus var. bracteatus TaxID=296719 RepID=A0A6V7NKQ4_ANACO|nr:unnamed protein product [Ananas comosus var. bracteatus]